MIRPEEQAEHLIMDHIDHPAFACDGKPRSDVYKKYKAAQNALVTVNTILKTFGSTVDGKMFYTSNAAVTYWDEVKSILEKKINV